MQQQPDFIYLLALTSWVCRKTRFVQWNP